MQWVGWDGGLVPEAHGYRKEGSGTTLKRLMIILP